MAYSVSEVITLGIGTPSDIPSFILFGLSTGSTPPPPSTGEVNNALTGDSANTGGGDIEEL